MVPRDPNKIKTSLSKAVQKQALLWSDGDLIMRGHRECTAWHWLNPCHPAQPWKNWTFRPGNQGSAPHTAPPLLFALPSSIFNRITSLRRTSNHACVCMQGYSLSAALQTATAHQDCCFLHHTFLAAASMPWRGFPHQSSKWIPLWATEREERQNFFSFWKWWHFSAVQIAVRTALL